MTKPLTDNERAYRTALDDIRRNMPNGEQVATAVEAWVSDLNGRNIRLMADVKYLEGYREGRG